MAINWGIYSELAKGAGGIFTDWRWSCECRSHLQPIFWVADLAWYLPKWPTLVSIKAENLDHSSGFFGLPNRFPGWLGRTSETRCGQSWMHGGCRMPTKWPASPENIWKNLMGTLQLPKVSMNFGIFWRFFLSWWFSKIVISYGSAGLSNGSHPIIQCWSSGRSSSSSTPKKLKVSAWCSDVTMSVQYLTILTDGWSYSLFLRLLVWKMRFQKIGLSSIIFLFKNLVFICFHITFHMCPYFTCHVEG